MCFQLIISHSIEPPFLVTLIHSEDVWNRVLIVNNVTWVCSFAWTILSPSPEKPCCQSRRPQRALDVCSHIAPSCWDESTDKLVCMWDCFSLFNLFPLFLNDLFVYKWLCFVINWPWYGIVVSEFWMSPVVCTQITAKRLSLLVTRKQKPDLFLNGLGKAQNMQER